MLYLIMLVYYYRICCISENEDAALTIILDH